MVAVKSRQNPLYQDKAYCDQFRKLHQDASYRAKVHNIEACRKISGTAKANWADGSKRAKYMILRQTEAFRQRVAQWSRLYWANEDYRAHQLQLRSTDEYRGKASEHARKLWMDPIYREKLLNVLDRARPLSACKTTISSLQVALYAVLDDLSVEYCKEGPKTVIGPIITSNSRFEGYCFDCLVTHPKKLFIECQGEYWHHDRDPRDSAKATFLRNYYPEYDLLAIWEHQFRSRGLVRSLVAQRLDIDPRPLVEDFDFKNVVIKSCDPTPEYRSLFAQYHYLTNLGRAGSVRYGAFINGELVAGAVFAGPTRHESALRLGLGNRELLELTRFCINPRFQKYNFASWLLSRVVALVWENRKEAKTIISFADTTYGHTGTIYRAANWQFDGEVKPDYWYTDTSGAWYHKKSIWDMARKMCLSETDYAVKHGLHKVFGQSKLRFIIRRKQK